MQHEYMFLNVDKALRPISDSYGNGVSPTWSLGFLLDALGEDGWELVTVHPDDQKGYLYHFKRPLE